VKLLENVLVAIVAALAPIHAVMGTVLLLVAVDLITGIWAAYKRGDKILSAKMKRSVGKLVLYEVAVILAFFVEKYLIGDLLPALKLVSGLIGLTEFKSILENLNTISGQDLFKTILDRIASVHSPKNEDKK
jgi:hypothetical protein